MMSCELTTLQWAQERLANTERIAITLKSGAELDSWLEDMAYWMAIVADLTAGTWNPIETAPKDGTIVMLGAPGIVEVGYWQDFHKAETECGVPVECDVDEGWYGSLDIWPSGKQPTHWMPLPLPPANTEAVTP